MERIKQKMKNALLKLKSRRIKAVVITMSLCGWGWLLVTIIPHITAWINNNTIVTRRVPFVLVISEEQKTFDYVGFVDIKPKEEDVRYVFVGQDEVDELIAESEKPELAEYICEKFGPTQCATALAVVSAESGWNTEALNLNGGRSLDVGLFQINYHSHKDKPECALNKLVDPYTNVDCAYVIYTAQSWNPWVAYTDGSYLSFMLE